MASARSTEDNMATQQILQASSSGAVTTEEANQGEDVERVALSPAVVKTPTPRTLRTQITAVLGSWLNILLIAAPVGIALNYALGNSHRDRIIVFVINFVAIMPLAGILAHATEELALYFGDVLGGLLNASFGNAVELIVSIIALAQGKIVIVQTSLVGSILSNLLLVLGTCFLVGGLGRDEQYFNITVAQAAAVLLILSMGSLVLPTAFRTFSDTQRGIAPISRGCAVLLLFAYACSLTFQLRTHAATYQLPSQKSPKKRRSRRMAPGTVLRAFVTAGVGRGAAACGGQINQTTLIKEKTDEETEDNDVETPQLSRVAAFATLAVSTVIIALCAEYMVSSIDAISEDVSQEFIGLILLPIVSNAAEHATAVIVSSKDKMDLAIGVALGSSLQIGFLVLPAMVLLSWFGVGSSSSPVPMTLNFDGFLVSALVITVLMVNYVIQVSCCSFPARQCRLIFTDRGGLLHQDGKSHWFEGMLLIITYLVIALSAWFYPVPDGLE